MLTSHDSFIAMAPKPDLTGFDPSKFASASGHVPKDPWGR